MLGKVFALCTDEEQAEFLNEAGRTLRRVTARLTSEFEGYGMQLCRIVDHLDDDGRRLVRELAGFVESDETRGKS